MLANKTIKIIFASATDSADRMVIGKDNKMPWAGMLPSDMKRFRELTTFHSVVMGRKTWDSLANFKPLPNRQNIILTRDPNFAPDYPASAINSNTQVVVAHSLEEALQKTKSENVWIIGGAEIYALAFSFADYIHWTEIIANFEGDAFFPPFEIMGKYKIIANEFCATGVSGTEKRKDQLNSVYRVLHHI